MVTSFPMEDTPSTAAPSLVWHEAQWRIRERRRQTAPAAVAFLLLLGCLAPFAGCSLTTRQKSLTVQAFIVTNERDNITLGLLSICAAPADRVGEYVSKYVRGVDAETADKREDVRLLERDRVVLAEQRALLVEKLENLTLQRSAADLTVGLLKAPVDEFDVPGGLDAARRAVALAADQALNQSRSAVNANDAKKHVADFERLDALVKRVDQLAADAKDTSRPVDATLVDLRAFFTSDAMRDFPDEQAYVCRSLERIVAMIGDSEDGALLAKIDALSRDIDEHQGRISQIRTKEALLVSKLSSLRKEVANAESLDELWGALPAPTAQKKTDPNGVAIFELDSRLSWVLWAKAERKVGDHDERYYWIVKVPPSDAWKPQEPFFLSNDNQLHSVHDLDFLGVPLRVVAHAVEAKVPQ